MTPSPSYRSAQPDDVFPSGAKSPDDAVQPTPSSPGSVPARGLQGDDLEAALRLLVERARYITGATGAALALLQGEEMVCRASAGSCAPAIGARLQVRSGLTGESISRKQLLRCDNAENDPRVNIETCRELGIASIVVLPLLARSGEVRGLFELFSDHPYAFEERDLVALERMAELTRTALDLSYKREASVVVPVRTELTPPAQFSATPGTPAPPVLVSPVPNEETAATALPLEQPAVTPQIALPQPLESPAAPAGPVPEAMMRVQKCVSCGFPVSEGRMLCVDCEDKRNKQPESTELMPAEYVPAFLASPQPHEESWLANHVNLLAVLVLILSIIVAVVVFR